MKSELPGLPVVGTIRAGAWIESYMLEHDDRGGIPVARDPQYPHARQYALYVSGDSMDQEAPDGSYVVCVDFGESGLALKPGMIAHIEAMEHGKSETTLKEVSFENGQVVLLPRSSNPIYKAVPLNGADDLEIYVRGIVLSVYKPKRW